MNFLSKTLGSFTFASIPYTFKDKIVDPVGNVADQRSVWTVYEGTNQKGKKVSIFEYSLKDEQNIRKNYELLARNAYHKAKLIKFPELVSVSDFVENDNYLYLITEPVVPLLSYLKRCQISQESLIYGIHNIAKALAFINDQCNCVHANLNVFSSVYVNEEGDWKLSGLELLTNLTSDPDQPLYRLSSYSPSFGENLPDDVISQGLDAVRQFPSKLDSYLLGHFIYTLFTTKDFSRITSYSNSQVLATNSAIPKQLAAPLKRLVSNKTGLRTTVAKFINDAAPVLNSNRIIQLNKELQELQFKEPAEKTSFFRYNLAEYFNDNASIEFHPGFLENKLLPELVAQYNTIEQIKPSINSTPEEHQQNQETLSVLLNYILKVGSMLPPAQFDQLVKPVIFKSFTSTDRSVRLILLNHLSAYKDKLTESDVQAKIFHNLLTGFQDTNFVIRETTLRSITTVIDKISDKQVNQDLLKILAKSQMDPKPSIRTNTLVLIIKVSEKIYRNSRNNVVITALSKSLRDSFTPCKMMALSGFEKLIDQFALDEICTKILGQLAISLMDNKSAKVRNEADRIFRLYLQSVHEHASTLPEGEEDEEKEEREFFKKYAPTVNEAESDKLIKDSQSSTFSFGWNVVNKLVSSSTIDGQLNKEFNRSTPDVTRKNSIDETKKDDTWNDELDDNWLSNDEDDNNGDTNSEVKKPIQRNAAQSFQRVKLKPAASTTKPNAPRKSSSLKLGNPTPKNAGSTLKLVMDNEGEDEWGEDDNW